MPLVRWNVAPHRANRTPIVVESDGAIKQPVTGPDAGIRLPAAPQAGYKPPMPEQGWRLPAPARFSAGRTWPAPVAGRTWPAPRAARRVVRVVA